MLSVKPTFQVANSWEVVPLCSVVGAVTDRFDMAEYFYRVSVCHFWILAFFIDHCIRLEYQYGSTVD